jgi:cytidyltransferase-like protein
MKKVFVSGCYDILHAGHITFFEDARALGDHLTVSFASDEVLKLGKGRAPSIPEDHKMLLIGSLRCVDHVVKSSNLHPIFDFVDNLKIIKPDIAAVTDDDRHVDEKKKFFDKLGIKLVILPKRTNYTPTSTTSILAAIKNIVEVPLRVDFAGGWLDVPKFSRKGSYIVNCAIMPKVSLNHWPYEQGAGLGGSAAHAILKIKNGMESELDLGVGWQDPAVIQETGLCVWRSGKQPIIEFKSNPDWLTGRMLIVWTGNKHDTPHIVSKKRDYQAIVRAGKLAAEAAFSKDFKKLCKAVSMSYQAQLKEGMKELKAVPRAWAKKYLGGGHGGYALYLFDSAKDRAFAAVRTEGGKIIEPYLESYTS